MCLPPAAAGLDVVGDVHGRAAMLRRLLQLLGYAEREGRWSHPEGRRLVFVGDLIDVNTPGQRLTLDLVRSLMRDGVADAVMGNHERNAILYSTPDPARPGDYLRTHRGEEGKRNREQHAPFLAEYGGDPAAYADAIGWMLRLPLWMENEWVRVVHACWDQESVDALRPRLRDRRLRAEDLAAVADSGTGLGAAVNTLVKGREVRLPEEIGYMDGSGHRRTAIRQAWWRPEPRRLRDAVLLPAGVDHPAWDEPVPEALRMHYREEKPTFFGHYCMSGPVRLETARTVCLDTCASRRGSLSCYRWSGEADLDVAHVVEVPAA